MKKFIIPLTLLLIAGLYMQAQKAQQGYAVGDYAKDFALAGVDGKRVSMADFPEAKGFVVVFTCNECPYAKAYEDRINALNRQYQAKGYSVIAINPNSAQSKAESVESMKQRAQSKNFSFPYLADETQDITRAYGATNTPHVYILQKETNDKFKVMYTGTIDNNYKDAAKASRHYVQEALDALLSEQPVQETSTKAIGCTIKWKDA